VRERTALRPRPAHRRACAASARPRRADPEAAAAARGVDADARPEARRDGELPPLVGARAVVSAAREAILARIADAVGEAQPPVSVAREYRRAGQLAPAERVAPFFERVGDDRADGRPVCAAQGAGAVADGGP